MSDSESDAEESMQDFEEEHVIPMERLRVVYEPRDKKLFESKQYIYSYELVNIEESEFKRSGNKTFFMNHFNISNRIVQNFENGKIVYQLVVARTQSGKTSAMLKTIELYMEKNLIPLENIYVITGLSSTSWVNQTKDRFPECMHPRIIHNAKLMENFKKDIKDKKNCLIMIDEVQMACQEKQTFGKIMIELGWNTAFLLENDIKMVQFSATPDGIMYAYKQWNTDENYKFEYMQEGDTYFGTKQMRERNQLRQCESISFHEDYIEHAMEYCSNILSDILSFRNSRYHLIRLETGTTPEQYLETFKTLVTREYPEYLDRFCFDSHSYTMDGDIETLDDHLKKKPVKHGWVFIKHKLKCADTIRYKKHIGVMVDRLSRSDSFMIQAFLGRGCGYEPHDMIIYTNLSSIERYDAIMECIKTGTDFSTIEWNSNTTCHMGETTTSKKTYNRAESKEKKWTYECKEGWEKFESKKEYLDFTEKYKFTKSSSYEKHKKDGFYETTTTKGHRVYSYDEIMQFKESITLGSGSGLPLQKKGEGEKIGQKRTRLYVCYKNIKDPTTIVFVLRTCIIIEKIES
jgi:hypothetical protein